MLSARLYLIVAATFSLAASQTCYFPDGSIDKDSVPCGNINGYGNCCPTGSACMNTSPLCLWLMDWSLDRWSFTADSELRESAPCFFEPGNGHADMAPCLPNSDGSTKYCCGNALGCCNNSTKQGSWTLENTEAGTLSIVGATTNSGFASTVTSTVTQTMTGIATCNASPSEISPGSSSASYASPTPIPTGAGSSSIVGSGKLLSAIAAVRYFLL